MRKRLFAYIVIMCACLCLFSCSLKHKENQFIQGSAKIDVYQDLIYIASGTTVDVISIVDDEVIRMACCSDALCAHNTKTCPLFCGDGVISFAIDPEESKKNQNLPIMYLVYHDIYWNNAEGMVDKGYAIKRYDMANNTSSDIYHDSTKGIFDISLFGDTIYFRTYDYENEKYTLESIKKTGLDHAVLSCENEAFMIRNIINDNIYYSDSVGRLYCCTRDFDDNTYILDTHTDYGLAVVTDNAIYYPDDIKVVTTEHQKELRSCNIYKKSLNSAETPAEIVLSDVYYQGSPITYMGDSKIIFADFKNAHIYGVGWNYDYQGDVQEVVVIQNNGGKLYSYNTVDSTITDEVTLDGYDILSFHQFGDYYIFSALNLNEINLNECFAPSIKTIAYNPKTGNYYELD